MGKSEMSSARTKEVPTFEQVTSLLTYDPETGTFRWKIARGSGVRAGDIAGSRNARGYKYISINNAPYRAARLAWLIMTGDWPKDQIDHKDRDPTNDRWGNLRDVNNSQNQHNQDAAGSYWDKSRGQWAVKIRNNNVTRFLGRFETEEEARASYVAAKQEYLP